MEEYLKNVGITAGLTILLFISGSNYSFFFWTNFEFNITNIITVADIPKSIFTALIIAVSSIVLLVSFVLLKKRIVLVNKIFGQIIFALATPITVVLICYSDYFPEVFSLILLFLSFLLFRNQNEITGYLLSSKESTVLTISGILFLCAAIGKIDGFKIKSNRYGTHYVSHVQSTDSTLNKICLKKKLIGYIGDKIVLTDWNNLEFTIVTQSSFNSISFKTDTLQSMP